MKFYWIKTNWLIKRLFSNYTWNIPNNQKKVYLTFDDGPTPEITHWVLQKLALYNAKATFFCIGNNIEKNTEIYNSIISEGHTIGNHTFNHLNGWKTNTKTYLKNVTLCNDSIVNNDNQESNHKAMLFRPPYGKMSVLQSKKLQKLGYKIIMWDVLSADFDQSITKEKCLENVMKNTTSGSIIVFHDSVKAFTNLQYVLPKALEYLNENGFIFSKIN